MRERQLTMEEKEAIGTDLESGMRILRSKHGDMDPGDPGKTMSYLLEEISSDSIFLPEAVAVLMDCLERAVDWKPAVLEGERFSGKAMVSPDGSYAVYPELVIGKAMRNPEESNLLLFFNMIEGGSLPPSSVDRYTILS